MLYLDIPGAGGNAAAPDERWVVLGIARLQVHLQTIHLCTLIFQVRVVVLLLQMKERSLQDTLASRYTYKRKQTQYAFIMENKENSSGTVQYYYLQSCLNELYSAQSLETLLSEDPLCWSSMSPPAFH